MNGRAEWYHARAEGGVVGVTRIQVVERRPQVFVVVGVGPSLVMMLGHEFRLLEGKGVATTPAATDRGWGWVGPDHDAVVGRLESSLRAAIYELTQMAAAANRLGERHCGHGVVGPCDDCDAPP